MMKYLLAFIIVFNVFGVETYNYIFEIKASKNKEVQKLFKKLKIKSTSKSWRLRLTPKIAQYLESTKYFNFIEKDQVLKMDIDHSVNVHEKNLDTNWHMKKINIKKAWNTTKGSKDIIVAVCDSGVDVTRPELKGKVLKGWNFLEENEDTTPNTNHGTAVSGFLAASYSQEYGSSGSAPGIKILPGKIVSKSGGVPTSAMLGCIRWAADQGAKVINVSMTGVNSSSSHSAAKYAYEKGSLVVWAAGNANRTRRRWYNKKEILAVGGTNKSNSRYRASFRYGSQRGPFVDIVAPGQSVQFLRVGGGYGNGNGTSYSAPIVSGVAALVFSVNKKLTPDQVTEILKLSAKKIGSSSWSYGAGLVDAAAAVELAKKY